MDSAPKIRPSSLSGYYDCSRRTAANLFTQQILSFGYELRDENVNIGSAIGDGVHAAAHHILQHKIDTGFSAPLSAAEEVGVNAFEMSAYGEGRDIVWDKVTTSKDEARAQVKRKTQAFATKVAPHIKPSVLEERFEANYNGLVVSGQPDIIEEDGTLSDLKTGKWKGFNAPQYGGYSLLLESHQKPVARIREIHMPLVALRYPEPQPEFIIYDVAESKRLAEYVMEDMVMDYKNFMATGDRRAFRPNPSSNLCDAKYCRAFGTSFCKEYKRFPLTKE